MMIGSSRKWVYWVPVLSLLWASCFGGLFAAQSQAGRPNIIVLLADDLGYGELGCQGNPEIPTPNIDSIAEAGVRFTSGYVSAAYCSASRAGFITGRFQTRFGHEFNPIGAKNEDPDIGLPASQVTIAEHLHDAGYTTGLIGKWHLGGTAAYHPIRRGFDEFFGFMHEGHYYVSTPYQGATTMLRRKTLPFGGKGMFVSGKLIYSTHTGGDEPAYDADNPILRGGQPVHETAYLTDVWTREAVDFIGRHRDKPFFLYLAYNAVHSPLQGADAYMKRFEKIDDIQRRIFAAMLSNLDDSVGAVLKKVRDEGLEENTLVFFLSDNGGPTRELTSSNLPLRGGKGEAYEGGIRIPFMVQWKGKIPAGVVYDKPVISLDIFATAATVAKAPIPDSRAIDGVDLLPYLTGKKDEAPHETLYWRMGTRTALRLGDWKLVRSAKRGQQDVWELYNLAKDIDESDDLAQSSPKEFERLKSAWERMNSEMVEPAWGTRR